MENLGGYLYICSLYSIDVEMITNNHINMKKTTTLTYVAPECVYMDLISECVLCASPAEGSIIDDYDYIQGDWN